MLLVDEAETLEVGAALARVLRAGDVITLSGSLGAGKTTLARGLLKGLGFADEVQSPSFPIIIPYELPDVRLPLWHVDLYRIESPAEIRELALGEALADAALLIEWPERLPGGGWAGALALSIEFAPNAPRRLTAQRPPAWESRWPF